MIFNKNFLLCLIFTAILIILPAQLAFANAESEYHNSKGDEYYNDGNFWEALEEYQQAINIEAKPEYYNNLGWAYYKLKQYTQAEESFNKVPKDDSNYAGSREGLAWVYYAQGKEDEAAELFKKASQEYSDSESYENAIRNFTMAIKIDDKNAFLYLLRGMQYILLDKYDEGLEDLNRAIQLDSNLAMAYRSRALTYKIQGKKEEAKKNFLLAGKKYLNKNEYDNAREALNEALEIDENYGEVYAYLAQVENRQNKYQEAIDNFDKAISLGFIENWVYNNRGFNKYKLKRYEEAIEDFNKNIELYPTFEKTYKNRGDCYFAESDWKNAMKDFQKYLELKGDAIEEADKADCEKKIKTCQVAIDNNDIYKKLVDLLEEFGYFGEVTKFLITLLGVMLVGYVVAIALDIHQGTFTAYSTVGHLFIKIILLTIIIGANSLDESELVDLKIRNATIAMIFIFEVISIVDNSKRLGAPVPDWLYDILKKIKDGITGIFDRILGRR